MKLTDNIVVFELKMRRLGYDTVIYPTIIWDEKHMVMIDTGLTTSLLEIIEQAYTYRIPLAHLSHIILSHQDLDHIGSVPHLMKVAALKPEIISHELEKPYIQGEKPMARANSENVSKMMSKLTDDLKNEMLMMLDELKHFEYPIVTKTFKDEEVLPICGGLTVIHTPGHTDGHICVYLNESKILIAGDALDVIDGELFGPKPGLSTNESEAYDSIKKLMHYDIEIVVCYHGGVYRGNVKERLKDILNT